VNEFEDTVSVIDIAKKHKIPLIIIEIFKRRIDKGQ
jgi:hypothetical protein